MTRYVKMLKRYTTRPEELRALLDDTNSAISGSFALELTDLSTLWQSNDLDIYTTHFHNIASEVD